MAYVGRTSGLRLRAYVERKRATAGAGRAGESWAKAFVDLPMAADPGTVGCYCSGGFLTAGRIIERVVGKSLPDFAHDVLFAPLGVRRADWKWTFLLDRSQR